MNQVHEPPFLTALETAEPQLVLTVQTNKTFYSAGQVVKIFGVVQDINGTPIKDASVGIEVKDPRNNTIFLDIVYSLTNGSYKDSFRLSITAFTGQYTVFVTANKSGYPLETGKTTFYVGIYSISHPPTKTIYEIKINVNATFNQGTNLTIRFYTYNDQFQAQSTIWNRTTQAHVELHIQVQHPLNIPVEIATLALTDQAGNVISNLTTFIMHRSHLMGRLGELDYLWTVPGADRTAIMNEYVAIDGQWPYAPP